MAAVTGALNRGVVKQVLSGDAVIVRGQPKGGPPPERTVCLSNVTAPRLARRPNPAIEAAVETKDEPYAWESREFLRKKLVGKEVTFTVEYRAPGTGREYGFIYLGKDAAAENITELMVTEGLVEVRRGGLKPNDEGQQRLISWEDTAKAAGKGKWAPPEEHQAHVRDVKWTLENPRHFVESLHGKTNNAVIEHVRDGCTVRAFLTPSFQYVTVMLSGIKAPMFKMEDDKNVPEPYAEEAKFYVESRLLQRDVQIVLEGEAGQTNLLGTVIHPNGNISELLLREGFARCADWSMGLVSQGASPLREAEKIAREKKLRVWKDYTPSTVSIDIKDKNYTAKVVEVVNGDCMIVKLADNSLKKIFLASIRQPRPTADSQDATKKTRSRPLYDIPFMFEAREFLRKKLIGKKVNIQVDYIQPKNDDYPEKTCATVTISNINVAEALVSKGLATVVRYRQGDDQRSACYDVLLSAEERAKKKMAGVHSKKETAVIRVADISGDVPKAKQFFPFLQRAGRVEAVVEFVASGSRLRLYIPRETCLITFLLAGIQCPRGSRPAPNMPQGTMLPGEPFGEEAMLLTKELVLQREVEVEVEAQDKGGNFIGWLFVENTNMSVSLVQEGLSSVHYTAERSNFFSQLSTAQEKAKADQLNIWKDYEEPVEVKPENEPQERQVNHTTVLITDIGNDLHFYGQNTETGPQLEKLMEQLHSDLTANPPLPGSYTPRKGDICACKFVDGEWYRAKVERVTGGKVSMFYIDYGNREQTSTTQLASLPTAYSSLPPQARHYGLACVALAKDDEDIQTAIDAFYNETFNKQFLLNVEYKANGVDFVSLQYPDTKEDVVQTLVTDGVLLVENRKEKRLAKLMSTYQNAQEKAKTARRNLWRYGDFTEDDAKEFGYQS